MNTLADVEPVLPTSIGQRPTEASAVTKAGRIWPVLVIATGLVASLTWSAFLVWIVVRIMRAGYDSM